MIGSTILSNTHGQAVSVKMMEPMAFLMILTEHSKIHTPLTMNKTFVSEYNACRNIPVNKAGMKTLIRGLLYRNMEGKKDKKTNVHPLHI